MTSSKKKLPKIITVVFITFFLLVAAPFVYAAQQAASILDGEWTWVDGATTTNQPGVYGTLGVAHADNVPGARTYPVTWRDSAGNLWLFGGYGYDSAGVINYLNDLWKFSPTSGEWTWVDGEKTYAISTIRGVYGTEDTPDAANYPGGRYQSVSWIDSSGNLWLFGGEGFAETSAAGYLNDLWMFNPTSGQWTWVDGDKATNLAGSYGSLGTASSSNVPGARDGAVSWIDGSGDLWLFGGQGCDRFCSVTGKLGDLWLFNPASGQWTWVFGPNASGIEGNYGTEDTPHINNQPGTRSNSVSWINSSGILWLYGGNGRDKNFDNGKYNDLWMFDPTSGLWTWVDGSDIVDQPAVYGTEDTPAVANVPSARTSSISWIDSNNKLWLFGGNIGSRVNDLWMFNPTSGQWTWVDGANTVNSNGVYGTEDTPAVGNVPGARHSSVSWNDGTNLWLFGGNGYPSAGSSGSLNDLWMLDITGTDTTGPTVDLSVPADGATLSVGPTQITVAFDENLDVSAAEDETNYLLVEAGDNGTFNTIDCAGGVLVDDDQIVVNLAVFDTGSYITTLSINGGLELPVGSYRLYVCGTTSIEDSAGNELNDGRSDEQINFSVSNTGSGSTSSLTLPKTGFSPGQVNALPAQPVSNAYSNVEMTLEIPSLNVSISIVGIPESEGSWDVTWLGDNAGYLSGTAFPTWNGNTVLTGHVWDSWNQPGPFVNLKDLQYGDQFRIKAYGMTYTYEVQTTQRVRADNINVLGHSEYDMVTLITCESYSFWTGEYRYRRAVQAVLVNVASE